MRLFIAPCYPFEGTNMEAAVVCIDDELAMQMQAAWKHGNEVLSRGEGLSLVRVEFELPAPCFKAFEAPDWEDEEFGHWFEDLRSGVFTEVPEKRVMQVVGLRPYHVVEWPRFVVNGNGEPSLDFFIRDGDKHHAGLLPLDAFDES